MRLFGATMARSLVVVARCPRRSHLSMEWPKGARDRPFSYVESDVDAGIRHRQGMSRGRCLVRGGFERRVASMYSWIPGQVTGTRIEGVPGTSSGVGSLRAEVCC